MLEAIEKTAEKLGIEVTVEESKYEFNVTGNPWCIAQLYEELKKAGYKVVASRTYLGTIFVRK